MPDQKRTTQNRKKKRPGASTFGLRAFHATKTAVAAINRFTTQSSAGNERRPLRLFGRTLTFAGFLAILMVLFIIVVLAFNDRSIGTANESVVIAGLSDDFENYKILHISDLAGKNFGQNQSTLARQINALSYNMVLLTGDMVGEGGDPTALYDLLSVIGSKIPVYFIAGDSDPSPLLSEARPNEDESLTLNQMIYADWVLGAIERGAIYVDLPIQVTRGSSSLWLLPEYVLNLNTYDALDDLKAQSEQEQEGYLAGVKADEKTLPFTTYRYTRMFRAEQFCRAVGAEDLVLMLTHEIPSDARILVSQDSRSADDAKKYYPSPDIILAGHYCGGEWKLPGGNAFYIPAALMPRHGWFPDPVYVQGQRSVGSTTVYVSPGLSTSGDTILDFRLLNPPQITLISLTGELPASILGE